MTIVLKTDHILSVPNVPTVPKVPKMTKNDVSVPKYQLVYLLV